MEPAGRRAVDAVRIRHRLPGGLRVRDHLACATARRQPTELKPAGLKSRRELSAGSGRLCRVMNAKIEAVLFDWGGTLATWHDISLHETWRAVTTVLDEANAEELATRLVAAEGSMWRRSRDEHRSSTLE